MKDLTYRNPLLSKLAVLSNFGIPAPLSCSIIVLLIYHLWLVFINIFFGVKFPSFNNIFYIRDLLLMIVFLPAYAIFSKKVDSLQHDVITYMESDEEYVNKIFERLYSALYSKKWLALFIALLPIYYVGLITRYVITGYYTINFYLYRLVAVVGLAILGGVVYQMLVLIKFFLTDAKLLEPNPKALVEGMPPVKGFIFWASAVWLSMGFIDMITSFVLGFNVGSFLWYITFYGLLYLISFLLVFSALQGFHESLSNTKKLYLEYILSAAPRVSKSNLSVKRFRGNKVERLLKILHEKRISVKDLETWPISKYDAIKLSLILTIVTLIILIHFI